MTIIKVTFLVITTIIIIMIILMVKTFIIMIMIITITFTIMIITKDRVNNDYSCCWKCGPWE